MKKTIILIMLLLCLMGLTSGVWAEPGPYDATMSVDGYDTTPDAVPTPNQTSALELPQLYETIEHVLTSAGLAALGLTSNKDTDSIQVLGPNAYWHEISGPGLSGDFAAVSITAAAVNTLGVFKFGDLGSLTFVVPPQTGATFLGTGTFLDPYPGGINPFPGDNFGFALKSKKGLNPEKKWYSDPTLNLDGLDKMLAFYLPQLDGKEAWIDLDDNGTADSKITFSKDTYVLAWEDLEVTAGTYDGDYNDTIFLVTRITPVPEPMSMFLLGSGFLGLAGVRRRKV